jgi:hypothetical protein
MMAAGTVAAMIYNVNRGKDDDPVSVMDFVPDFKKKPVPQEEDDEARAASMIAFFSSLSTDDGRKVRRAPTT